MNCSVCFSFTRHKPPDSHHEVSGKYFTFLPSVVYIISSCLFQAVIGMVVARAMCEAEAEADPVLTSDQEQFLRQFVATGLTDPKTGYVYHVNPLHPNVPVVKDGDAPKLVLPPSPYPYGRGYPFYPNIPCASGVCRGLPNGPYGAYGPYGPGYYPRQYPVYPSYGPLSTPYNPFYQGFVPPQAILAQPASTDEE